MAQRKSLATETELRGPVLLARVSGVVTAHRHRTRKLSYQAAPNLRLPWGRHRLRTWRAVAHVILVTVLAHTHTARLGEPLGTLVAQLRLGPQYCVLPVARLQSTSRSPTGTYKAQGMCDWEGTLGRAARQPLIMSQAM